MATQENIEARRSVIRGWLEAGIKHGSVAAMIQTRFHVSRSTAYSEISTVSNEINASQDDPRDGTFQADDPQSVDAQSLLAQLQYQFDVASASGDVKNACQLIKAMDTVRRWNGKVQESVKPMEHSYS